MIQDTKPNEPQLREFVPPIMASQGTPTQPSLLYCVNSWKKQRLHMTIRCIVYYIRAPSCVEASRRRSGDRCERLHHILHDGPVRPRQNVGQPKSQGAVLLAVLDAFHRTRRLLFGRWQATAHTRTTPAEEKQLGQVRGTQTPRCPAPLGPAARSDWQTMVAAAAQKSPERRRRAGSKQSY